MVVRASLTNYAGEFPDLRDAVRSRGRFCFVTRSEEMGVEYPGLSCGRDVDEDAGERFRGVEVAFDGVQRLT